MLTTKSDVGQLDLPDGLVSPIENLQVTIKQSDETPGNWDAFASRCGASFRASYYGSQAWQFDYHLWRRMRRVCCFIQAGGVQTKIAQVAIGFGRKLRVFGEGIQLLPEFQFLWKHVMTALLKYYGKGEYHYGSPWSLEPCRRQEFGDIAGVNVRHAQKITVFAVDFAQWDNWEAYFKSISTNAKRNAKRAEKTYEDLGIEQKSGLRAVRCAWNLFALRRQLHTRKSIAFSYLKLILRFILRIAAMREGMFIALAHGHQQPIAGFGGIAFGGNTYYLESGSREDNHGGMWYLLLAMVKQAYERAPDGQFVTGYHRDNTEFDKGLDFSRSQCRATANITSELIFSYT